MKKIFKRRWFMHDMARQRFFDKREFTAMLDLLKRAEYNGLGLYLEGAMHFKSFDGIIHDGVITYDDAKWIVAECEKRGIFVFPMTNVVGHMEHFFTQERFRSLKSDGMTQLNFYDPRAEELVMKIACEYNDAFGTGMVHIGGDEAALKPEQKHDYAKFLAKICQNLLELGIQPAVWNDMLWMDTELLTYFDKRVFMFDWNYYGHRPESIRFFREEGFENFVVCPCDNSWETLITYQTAGAHLKAHAEIPIRPDEIEAFLVDEAENGAPDELGALITNWENSHGRNNWCQWSAIARAGLFMTGRLGERERNDELIEKTLFGRITPYTDIVYLLQNVIEEHDMDSHKFKGAWSPRLRSSLFSPKALRETLLDALTRPTFVKDFGDTLDKADKMLLSWTPEGDIETLCHTSMNALLAMLRAGNELVKAFGECRRLYGRAAELQFSHPETAAQLLHKFIGGIRIALEYMCLARNAHAEALGIVAIEDKDIVRMNIVIDLVDDICDEAESTLEVFDRIPLPIFEKVIIGQIDKLPVEGKVYR